MEIPSETTTVPVAVKPKKSKIPLIVGVSLIAISIPIIYFYVLPMITKKGFVCPYCGKNDFPDLDAYCSHIRIAHAGVGLPSECATSTNGGGNGGEGVDHGCQLWEYYSDVAMTCVPKWTVDNIIFHTEKEYWDYMNVYYPAITSKTIEQTSWVFSKTYDLGANYYVNSILGNIYSENCNCTDGKSCQPIWGGSCHSCCSRFYLHIKEDGGSWTTENTSPKVSSGATYNLATMPNRVVRYIKVSGDKAECVCGGAHKLYLTVGLGKVV